VGPAGGPGRRRTGRPAPPRPRHAGAGLAFDGRAAEGLARLDFLAAAPSEVAGEDTDALILRGMVRALTEDLAGAIADLSTAAARLRAGSRRPWPASAWAAWPTPSTAPGRGTMPWCTASWPSRSLVTPTGPGISASSTASRPRCRPPAATGTSPAPTSGWPPRPPRTGGSRSPIAAAATAQGSLALAQGDLEGAVGAAAAVRATGKAKFLGRPGHFEWRSTEIDALIGLARPGQAEAALAEFEAALRSAPPSARVAAARLQGDLAAAAGRPSAAAEAFSLAWRQAENLRVPLSFALLEMSDGRRLRAAGQPERAVARLHSARQRLIKLAARPYLDRRDRELTASGAAAPAEIPAAPGLTPAELAVARLVATGRSNREAAAELYVSIKTIEFHLRHIFAKLGIRSRRELIARLGGPEPRGAQNQGRA